MYFLTKATPPQSSNSTNYTYKWTLGVIKWWYSGFVLRKSIPRQVDKKSRGPWGERGLGFLRRRKRQTFFFSSTFLCHSHIIFFFLSLKMMITQQKTQFKICIKDYIATLYPAWRQFPLPKSSVQSLSPVMSNSLQPHGMKHTRLPCPSPTPRGNSNSCPLSQWCYPTISSSVVPFSSCF